MAILKNPRRRAFVFGVFAALGGALFLGTFLVLSGVYNVGASAKHFYLSDRLLKLILWRSVEAHSAGIEVPDLDDEGLIRLGARHFVTGCQPCHAGPGIEPSPVARGMYPVAPPLGRNVESWDADELFWIVRHGLKFTGMPQWAGEGRDDEVWPVVAFIRQLPGMSAARYAELTRTRNTASFSFSVEGVAAVAACAECHGDARNAPVAGLTPAIQGQSPLYLRRALEEYASGVRESGLMEPIAAALAPAVRKTLADEFATMKPSRQQSPDLDADLVAAGEKIASEGIPQQNVPPCNACHSERKSPHFPRLEGLSPVYIVNQLRLFRERVRGGTPYGSIMAPIAGRLTADQADTVAAYFASRRRGSPAIAEDGEAPQ